MCPYFEQWYVYEIKVQSTNISILWTNDIYMIFMEQIFPWNNDMYMVFMEQICSYLEQLYGVVIT